MISRYSPPTPPDMRVRIRRFGRLRLAGQSRYSHAVEERSGQGDVERGMTRSGSGVT